MEISLTLNSHTIGLVFKATRTLNGMQQREFAKILGISQGYLSKIENGFLLPDTIEVFKFMKLININSDDLLNLTERASFYRTNQIQWKCLTSKAKFQKLILEKLKVDITKVTNSFQKGA